MENRAWMLMKNYRDGDDYDTSVILKELIYTTKEAAIESLRQIAFQEKPKYKEYKNVKVRDCYQKTELFSSEFVIGDLEYCEETKLYIYDRSVYWIKEYKLDCYL